MSRQLYDYIRIIKPAFIRYVKTISLLIALVCIIATIIVLSQSNPTSVPQKSPTPGGTSYDKKNQIDQAKKNTILRRFISYNPSTSVSF